MSNIKKVLVITYYFPPAGGAAVQRTLKFIRLLPSHEWEPVVLTAGNADYLVTDQQLLDNVPQWLGVYKSYIFEPQNLYMKFTNKDKEQSFDLSADDDKSPQQMPFKERVADFVRSWFFIPDPRVFWTPFAIWKGLQVIRKENIDLIYSSAPPNTVNLIAAGLKFVSGKKWVADFRDPWSKYLVPRRGYSIPQKLDDFLGKRLIKYADRVVCVGKGVKSGLEKTVGETLSGKITIITNGFDEEDFRDINITSSQGFTISYIGSVHAKYNFQAFITAIENCMQQNSDFRDDFRLIFCGRLDVGSKGKFEMSGFTDNIEFLGNKPHKEAMETMCASSLLLLYVINTAEGKRIPTSKLYEYIGSKRPILALAPEDSEASAIIKETGSGFIVSPNEAEAITATVLQLYQQWKQGKLQSGLHWKPERYNYESKSLTKRLARVFREANIPVQNIV